MYFLFKLKCKGIIFCSYGFFKENDFEIDIVYILLLREWEIRYFGYVLKFVIKESDD